MRQITIAIECLEYEYLNQIRPKNLFSLDIHPAKSWGATSRASIAALLANIFPECVYKDCYHNSIRHVLADPFNLESLKRSKIPCFLYCANGWGIELIKHYTPRDVLKLLLKQNRKGFDDKELIDDFLSREPEKLEKYYAYFHLMTTHPPFFDGNEGDPICYCEERRKEALLYVDEIIKDLLKLDAFIVVCSDHHIIHHTHHSKILDSFIAMKNVDIIYSRSANNR